MTNSNYIIRKTGTNYTQCVHRIRLRPIKLTEPPEVIQEIDPEKFEADPLRRTTQNGPELFDEYIPNFLEEEQSTVFSKTETVQTSQICLGVTVHLNGAPAVPLVAPLPPIVPIIPPIPVIPPAEIRTPSPMNSPRNSQENSPRASISDSPESIATPEQFQYPESPPGAAEGERIRANDEDDTEQQPGPGVIYLNKGTKITAESSRRSRRDQTPTTETKLDQVRSRLERYQRGSTEDNRRVARNQSKSIQVTSNINVIEIGKTRAKFFHHRGDILNSRRSFAHCISSDMKMDKGFKRQDSYNYPEKLQSQEFAHKPPIGSMFSLYETTLNRYIFNLITKGNYYDKTTYYHLSVVLHTLRFVMLKHNKSSINLPKFGCGLNQLSEKSVLRQIIEVFSDVPVKIHLYT